MDTYTRAPYPANPNHHTTTTSIPATVNHQQQEFYHNNYGSLKPRNFEHHNHNPNSKHPPGASVEKLSFEDEPNFAPRNSMTRTGFRIKETGEITPPNFYSNYDYSNSSASPPPSERSIVGRIPNQTRNGPRSAHHFVQNNAQSAAVVRQLRDKFNVIDNNGTSSIDRDRDRDLTAPVIQGSIIPPREFNNSGTGGKPLPSYGSLLANQRRDTENSGGGQDDPAVSVWTDWLQGRLPLLILLILFLLCLFLTLTGALIYFKYLPSTKIRRLPSQDEPCESTLCAFGASCRVESGRAACRCPENCASEYAPVCGYDDVTYGNECLLRKYMCQHQRIVQVRHTGECNEPDPCEDKACLYGSLCVPSINGLYATCECPTSCPNYGDTEESQPVCGSDGKIHKNKCELNRLACRLGKSITVKYSGKCDPCAGITCLAPQVCHLSEDRRPTCHCDEVCSMDFNPVCGSDGKTYSNECSMRQEACRSRRDLRIIYRGKCSSGVNPCESRTCRGYETCAINRFGIAQCTCAMVCDPVIQPVCGSDGKTYDNECQLSLTSCRDSKFISVAYKGSCDIESVCTRHNCTQGGTCFERNGEAICECPSTCPTDYAPVCGSDGISYQNECHLQLQSCSLSSISTTSSTFIQVMHEGVCNGCEKHSCEFYSVCELGPDGARCECPLECDTAETSSLLGPVCGTDGMTYDDECALQKSSCSFQKLIMVASRGHCDECANVHCKFGAKCESGTCVCPTECPMVKEPVCGSNLVTYTNECELRKTACRLGRSLNVHFYGDCSEGLGTFGIPAGGQEINEGHLSGFPGSGSSSIAITPKPNQCDAIRCDFDALCELDEDGFPRCTCQFNCTSAQSNPICGSDLKLYRSDCEMQREACQRQTELRPRPMELCEETEIKPCYGDEPIRNEETGNEISCGNGPSRTNCPPGSFCHRTSAFGKCCRKFQDIRTLTTSTTTTTTTASDLVLTREHEDSFCGSSAHGCCSDGVTAARGPNFEECPPFSPPLHNCLCNKLGSVTGGKCDSVTQSCHCRQGVGGELCDRCLPGFWGLSRISVQNQNEGCMACGCSKFGSVREDCEQMTGRCVCRPGVLGHKCDSCADGEFLGPLGCTIDSTNIVKSCEDLECSFGATCEEDGNRAGCACNILCDSRFDTQEVCASDGFTYQSECHVRLQSCRSQIGIFVVRKGPCFDISESTGLSRTESPLPRKWTALQNTEPGDDMLNMKNGGDLDRGGGNNGGKWGDSMDVVESSAMKSTRHLPPMSQFHGNHYLYYKRVPPPHRFPTSATIQIRSYLGDMCQGNSECVSAQSTCRNGRCVCREGFYEDSERIQCKPVHSHLPGTTTCSKTLCDATSVCFDHLNGSYTCTCPLRTSNIGGIGCFQKEPPIPFFNGKSRILLGKLAGYHKLSIEVEITPYLDFAHGVIIFSSQNANGTGDFLSLALIDGFVEFRYDLGDGPLILKSASRITSGSTNQIVAKRYNRDGLLRVNDEDDIVGTSPGSMKSLNLENGGFIGHVPLNSTRVWDLVGTSNGFIGCLHKLKVGRRQIEFFEDKDPLIRSIQNTYQCPMPTRTTVIWPLKIPTSHNHNSNVNVIPTTTPVYTVYAQNEDLELELTPDEDEEVRENQIQTETPVAILTHTKLPKTLPDLAKVGATSKNLCPKKACRNHGECWTDESTKSGHKCVCTPEYSGKSCEAKEKKMAETGAVIDFRGFTYLELPKVETGARHVTIEMWVMLRSRNGLLAYSGQERGKGDCIALIISNGRSKRMKAAVQTESVTFSSFHHCSLWRKWRKWDKAITLNKWHWIVASRVGREGKLQIDGQLPQSAKSPPALSELNLELPLYIGGIRDINILHRDLGLLRPFDGALQYVKVNGETYHREIRDALRNRLVHRNEGPPCGASISPPCKNGGTCYPRLDTFACVCLSQFTGRTCEIRKSVSGPVRFDGQNFLKFPRKVSKQQMFNLSDYDDYSNEHFDSDLDELFAGFGIVEDHDDFPTDEFVELPGSLTGNITSTDDFLERNKAQRRNRLEIVFRTTSNTSGVILWTGREYYGEVKRGYLGVFISNGYLELRIDLGAPKSKKPVVLRSKVNVTDGRWHQILIARRRRLIVFQVDGSTPQRATSPVGSNVLFSDGKIWIGGVAPAVLHSEVPASYHQGFIGCIDLVRIEKRRLQLSKVAHDKGFALCDDDD